MKIEPYKEKYADVRDAINYLLQFKNGIVLEPMPQIDCKLVHSEDVDIFVFDFRMRFLVKEYHDNGGDEGKDGRLARRGRQRPRLNGKKY